MSRSYKKNPYITDQNKGRPNKGIAKRDAARKVRVAKDVPNGKAYRKFSESWDIRDFSFYDPTPKGRRK